MCWHLQINTGFWGETLREKGKKITSLHFSKVQHQKFIKCKNPVCLILLKWLILQIATRNKPHLTTWRIRRGGRRFPFLNQNKLVPSFPFFLPCIILVFVALLLKSKTFLRIPYIRGLLACFSATLSQLIYWNTSTDFLWNVYSESP